jgi:hypothetical protein
MYTDDEFLTSGAVLWRTQAAKILTDSREPEQSLVPLMLPVRRYENPRPTNQTPVASRS